ncbi:WD40-repeat-containing domain protein [Mycena rosella]|uniref:WD40-repeat-containing domain protein n=1 Tax=Mycena rosella TaxID=1033263 RepID=A0AAD7GQ64_MYCRO|nr:WD40-repeat-containing domain protein [Mycena rosella]
MPLRESAGERHSRPLTATSSFIVPGTSPASSSGLVRSASFTSSASGLVRSASFSSFHSHATTEAGQEPYYPEGSSKYALRDTRVAIDFSLPAESGAVPLAYSAQKSLLYFTRGNRVQYKSLITADAVSQLCKLPDMLGDLTLLAAGDAALIALASSTGAIQLWDAGAKKLVCGWTTKGAVSMAWSGPVLSVGGPKGAVRHYDTRVQPAAKMREQAAKVTRHQTRVAAMAWNTDGKLLASGDGSGAVYCWDARSNRVPLDVGEFVQRRKKIQHAGAVSALAWCPWQPKLLATGDVLGTVKLWTIDAASPHSNASVPGKLVLPGGVVALHFAPHYKELLSAVGSAPPATSTAPVVPGVSNAVATHALPSLRPIARTAVSVAGSQQGTGSSAEPHAVTGAVLAGHKIVLAVPGEGKLKVFEVWGKRREVRRQASFLGNSIR